MIPPSSAAITHRPRRGSLPSAETIPGDSGTVRALLCFGA
jgi:hypothetical protein